MTARAFAPAKINLTLHVSGRRADGYHLLDSLVVFAADLGDDITAAHADSLTLSVTGPFAEGVPTGEANLVLRAARALATARGVDAKAALTLDKNLPHGAGIGGGSSDAAATIRALAELWQVPPLSPVETVALGADVPVCMTAPVTALVSGIGEELRPLSGLPDFWLVLVNPGVPLATADVFCVFDGLHAPETMPSPPWVDPQSLDDLCDWLIGQSNDLTICSAELTQTVPAILDSFRSVKGMRAFDMSGSGSTCWGLLANQMDARIAATEMQRGFPDYWVRVTRVSS